jgi:hypothetical protein
MGHGVGEKHFNRYLQEFVYRSNRIGGSGIYEKPENGLDSRTAT